MPRLKTETIGGGNVSWLGSDHGIHNCRTSTLDVATFTAGTHYPNGFFPSGLPVNVANEGQVKPWTADAGEKLGFLLFDQLVDGATKIPAPILRHGIVKTARLPIAFAVPAEGAEGAESFIYITEAGA